MGEELANLNITKEEEESVQTTEDEDVVEEEFNFCLVERVLTDSLVLIPSTRNLLSELWHPLEGVSITKIEEKGILFRFYNNVDLKRVWDDTPWVFSRHLVIFHHLTKGEDPVQVLLNHTMFWVQIHNLPLGLMSEGLARQFGNFTGQFIEYMCINSKGTLPRRVTLAASKWLHEEPMDVGKLRMDWDKDKRGRKYGDVFYDQGHRWRHGTEGTSAPLEITNSDLEEGPIGLIDGKKRQILVIRKATDCNENIKLECSWSGAATETKISARSMERIRKKCGFRNIIMERIRKKCGFRNIIDVGAEGSREGGWRGIMETYWILWFPGGESKERLMEHFKATKEK
ncbi:hypothetical protein Goshw_024327 [Gossypium schwendimanii]|uniref:DUF4283 domain-containing protein n=1 Tax=Gossypium schwendimanii TaxID=34291 RepID=A0A7J9LYA2_GOSSC|nr:hypothetical protein [Gossypium schwendimanii]